MSQRRRGNVWHFVIELGPDASGKRRQIRRSGYRTKKLAAHAEVDERVKGGLALAPEADKLTVGEYLDFWLASKKRLKSRSVQQYETLIRLHLKPRLGKILLQRLRPVDVSATYDLIPTAGQRRATHGNVLNPALKAAVDLELIARNPVAKLRPEMPETRKRPFPTESQIAAVLRVADETPIGMIVRFVLFTGLRRGEVLGLKWEDVGEGEVKVVRQAQYRRPRTPEEKGTMILDTPKTKGSARSIALGADAVALLKTQRARQAAQKLKWGADYADQGLVFASPLGHIIDNDRRVWNQIAAAAGVPSMHFHDLRHAYATMSLDAGTPMHVVSQNLGHAGIAITIDLYSHVLPSREKAAAANLETRLREMGANEHRADG